MDCKLYQIFIPFSQLYTMVECINNTVLVENAVIHFGMCHLTGEYSNGINYAQIFLTLNFRLKNLISAENY